ncbi:MAG: DUF5911 domain-containing protein, partial [Chloroflexota bacterium]|nr:DUF5911 domain-containing protein [Chloroflexota bacterium]
MSQPESAVGGQAGRRMGGQMSPRVHAPSYTQHADHPRGYLPIESYGIIGDLQTVALVGLDGCIDFLCLPVFDSPSVFAALLDRENGGRFAIQPMLDGVRHKQLYLPDTNVLLTRFLSEEGVAEISDFMPIDPEPRPSRIVRRVKTVRGEVRFQVRCAPRFDYARARHTVVLDECGALFVQEGGGTALH